MQLKVREFGMTLHMNRGSQGSIYVYCGYIDVEGHPMHNRVIRKQIVLATKKTPGVIEWSIDGTPEAEVFTTLDALMNFYKLPDNQNNGTQKTTETTKATGTDAGALP